MGNRCHTVYPLLLIHGTGFRDRKHLNYWGRIPAALQQEGATVYYAHQDSWGTIENNAKTIRDSMRQILQETGCGKLNLIAHSKGGLDARHAISSLGMAPYTASLTTVSTPHCGSKVMDFFYRWPKPAGKFIALFVNGCFRLLGDIKPDFYTVCRQFSTHFCAVFNRENPNIPGVYYQSYACAMKNSVSDWIFWLSHFVIRRADGENDGLVTVESAKWGDFQGVVRGNTGRGFSHCDVVDLRRRDRSKVNIREIYVEMAERLKQKGF